MTFIVFARLDFNRYDLRVIFQQEVKFALLLYVTFPSILPKRYGFSLKYSIIPKIFITFVPVIRQFLDGNHGKEI